MCDCLCVFVLYLELGDSGPGVHSGRLGGGGAQRDVKTPSEQQQIYDKCAGNEYMAPRGS